MPAEIKITLEDIAFSEKILLPEGKTFDQERIDFICNLNTIDVQAVPGSGKTTALLAKLLILERHLPFEDGSGILVLSHTNTAINEIKNKIGSHCPKLLNYPNFIGTIQSFTDQFLAIPYGQNYLKVRLSWVDAEKYQNALWNEFSKIYWDKQFNQPGNLFWSRFIKRANEEEKKSTRTAKDICKDLIEKEVRDLYYDYSDQKIKVFRDDSTILATATNPRFIGIKTAIENVINSGLISYAYAYKLAQHYCAVYPQIIELLQKRFNYVFVDEMQDMGADQYNLLETLFFSNGIATSKFQRIGDKNQAIYNGLVTIQNIWSNRATVLALNGSHRLSPIIANIVSSFAINRGESFGINGLHACSIPPHLIIYDDNSIDEVVKRYAVEVKSLLDSGVIEDNSKNKYMAIAWNTVWKKQSDLDNIEKIRLIDYHKNFNKEKHKQKNEFTNLLAFLHLFNREEKSMKPVSKNVVNCLLKILRLEDVKDTNDKYYTERTLTKYLREDCEIDKYDSFKSLIYKASLEIIKSNESGSYNLITEYLPSLLEIFGKSIAQSSSFINSNMPVPPQTSGEIENTNFLEHNGITVNIDTVHSSKGQTHTCTLYLESYYYSDYETSRLAGQFKGQEFPSSESRIYHQQSTIMSYVGLSRPTHLLCIAVHKTRYDENLSDLDQWKIIDIT